MFSFSKLCFCLIIIHCNTHKSQNHLFGAEMTTGSLQVNHFFRASSDDSESWFSCALICYGWHGKLGSVLKFPWCEDCVDILFLDSNAGRLVTRVRSTVIIVGKWFWFQICENPVSNLNCIFQMDNSTTQIWLTQVQPPQFFIQSCHARLSTFPFSVAF